MTHDARIARIIDRLARLRAQNVETFGSSSHGFTLTSPLSEAELRTFEGARGVTLPDDFRAFLLLAGGSGAAPYYGLLPMKSWASALNVDEASAPDWLCRPCVFTPKNARGIEHDDAVDVSYAALVEGAVDPLQGTIAIIDQGCTYYGSLVVMGEARGRILYVDAEGGMPLFVESVDFLTWYERWLDELEWGHQHHWFGTGMAGDERALAAVLADDAALRKRDALFAMHRLPRLSDPTLPLVAARLHDEAASVREAALGVVAKFRVDLATADVRQALTDPDAGLRLAALEALVKLTTEWHPEARRCLADTDARVVRAALRHLGAAKALTLDEVLPLLDATDPGTVADAMLALQPFPSERAVATLLPRARAGTKPDALLALLFQVGSGVATPTQRDGAFEVLLARYASTTENFTAVVYGLGRFVATHPRALELLLETTRHPNGFARFDAAAVLGDVAGSEAIDVLQALTSDEAMPSEGSRGTVWSVGENARRAIEKIREREARS